MISTNTARTLMEVFLPPGLTNKISLSSKPDTSNEFLKPRKINIRRKRLSDQIKNIGAIYPTNLFPGEKRP